MDWAEHPRIREAASAIAAGEVIAYPTEAVWGLGCDPHNAKAVRHLLALKQRPEDKGLILIASESAQLETYIGAIDEAARARMHAAWPGPVTWLVPASGQVPTWIRGQYSSVALRVTAHPVAAGLCRAFGGAIVSTSANPADSPPARDVATLRRYFPRGLAAITPGVPGPDANPTEIRDLLTGTVLRPR